MEMTFTDTNVAEINTEKISLSNAQTCSSEGLNCIPIGNNGQHCIPVYPESPAPLPADTPSSELIEKFRKLFSEFIGTGLLVMVVVASGISCSSLTNDEGLRLLINALSTTAGLYGLITILGPVSGAHFNPVVSLVDFFYRDLQLSTLVTYVVAQICGGIAGALLANYQYAIEVEISSTERWGWNKWVSEVLATVTLIMIIHGCVRTGGGASVPFAVSAWVGGGYFFTSSSIFANPAVTIARIFTPTYAGIEPASAGLYIVFQLIGSVIGFGLVKFLYPSRAEKKSVVRKDDVLYQRACILVNQNFFEKNSY